MTTPETTPSNESGAAEVPNHATPPNEAPHARTANMGEMFVADASLSALPGDASGNGYGNGHGNGYGGGDDGDLLALVPVDPDAPTDVLNAAEIEDASGGATMDMDALGEADEAGDLLDSPSSSAVRQRVLVRAATPTLPRPRRPRTRLWKVLGAVLAVVLIVGGIGAFAYSRFTQPAEAAATFCHDLQTRAYSKAYALLSGPAAREVTSAQFVDAARTLDAAEGTVASCGQAAGAGAYSYSLGGSTASVALALTRSKGAHLSGMVHLADVHGAWKVTSAESSLFGVNLAALTAATAYCADLRAQNYSAAYALLDAGMRGQQSANDFTQQAQEHDILDGPVTTCAITGVSKGNTDASATLTTSITRTRLGARAGSLTLAASTMGSTSGSKSAGTAATTATASWHVRRVDTALQGSDLGGIQTAQRFCDDLGAGNYGDAYGLFTANLSGQMGSEAETAAFLDGQDGLKWLGCVPQVPTYAVAGSQATLTLQLILRDASSGQQGSGPATINLERGSAGWQIDNIGFPSNALATGNA